MKCPANFPQRHSIRRPGYDYSQPGAYFITLVTYQRQALLGEIMNGVMILNLLGQIAAEEWFKTSPLRQYVELSADEFVVMPNHVHGILHINANITTLERALRGNARSSKMISPKATLFHLPAFYLITAN
jgi:REP element-mobilizing transposase RayT